MIIRNFFYFFFLLGFPSLFAQLSGRVEENEVTSTEVYCLSEFGPQECLYLAWSWESAKKGYPYYKVTTNIIKAIANRFPVKLLYNESDSLEKIKACLSKYGAKFSNLELIPIESSTIWIRDTGPTFVKLTSGNTAIRNFKFNEWGYDGDNSTSTVSPDYQLKVALTKWLDIPASNSNMISEGGNHECNGKGTMILVESVELDRNPGWSRKRLEKELCDSLGLHKIIWLPFGLYEDGKTTTKMLPNEEGKPTYYTPLSPGGHVDEFCRFASEDTILLAEVTEEEAKKHPISFENYKRLEACLEILSKETTVDGKPFKICRVPTGPLIFDEFQVGDTFFEYFKSLDLQPQNRLLEESPNFPIVCSTSYLNYVKFNDCVLIPQYWTKKTSTELRERDKAVMKIFEKLYPSATLIPINVRNVNIAGGGLHCMTLNQPY